MPQSLEDKIAAQMAAAAKRWQATADKVVALEFALSEANNHIAQLHQDIGELSNMSPDVTP